MERFSLKSCHGKYVVMPFGKEPHAKKEEAKWGTKLRWYKERDFDGKNKFMISKNEEGVKSVWHATEDPNCIKTVD